MKTKIAIVYSIYLERLVLWYYNNAVSRFVVLDAISNNNYYTIDV